MSAATLTERVQAALGAQVVSVVEQHGEVTLTMGASNLTGALTLLRDHPALRFEQLIDLCGMDYRDYAGIDVTAMPARFAVVYHLLSITHNQRLRVRVFAINDDFPVLESAIPVWAAVNWYEREAFDLFGIVFTGHPDLRRLLTDYGFIGHPFRKDFPISGNVEMRYDAEQKRVVYQPVTIEPREVVPRIVREENYADTDTAGFRKG